MFVLCSNCLLLVTGLEVRAVMEADPMVEAREDTEEDRGVMEVEVRGDMVRVEDMAATELSDEEEIL